MPPKREAEAQGGGGASKKSRLTQKTAAEFFAENKHFAGALGHLFCSSVFFLVSPLVRSHHIQAAPTRG